MDKHFAKARKNNCQAAGWTLADTCTYRGRKPILYTELSDCFLCDFGDGVLNWPEGSDESLLTIAILHARNHRHREVRLSMLSSYVEDHLQYRYSFSPWSSEDVHEADLSAYKRLFPTPDTYDLSRADGPNCDYIRRRRKAGGYKHS